jgi:hypothetical protein
VKKSALCLATLLSLFCLPAQAHDVETGSIMVCDTQQQAERYAQVFDGNQQGAISVVNAEANNPSACAVVEVAFVAGPAFEIVRGKEHAFAVVPIAVIGFKAPNGIQRLQPTLVFTLVKLREFAV